MTDLYNAYQKLVDQRNEFDTKYPSVDIEFDPTVKQEIELLSKDVNATIYFLLNECTADQASYFSEVIDEVVQKTQSKELIEAYKKCILKYPEESKKYNLQYFADTCSDFLNEE